MLRIDTFATLYHRHGLAASPDNFCTAKVKIGEVQVLTWAVVMRGEFNFQTRFFDTLTGHLVTNADECNYTQEVIAEVLLLICMQECH